jgi:teichuronic acid biosynthesis glycosyltransferase TuaC
MKVLFVSSTNKKNDTGPIVKTQGEALRQIGITVDYFGIGGGGAGGYLRAATLLARHFHDNSYDIIHAHYGMSAWVALLAGRHAPLVVSFMGDDILGSNRHGGAVKKISLLIARINILFSKWFFSHSIVKSGEMLGKMNHKKVSVIPNGINLGLFCPADKLSARNKISIEPAVKLITFISDPSREEKNYLLAAEAVKLINDQAVILLPVYNLNQSNLPDYYNAADLVLLTSFHEGSPNVIKEAMACNCPVVSTDVGDVRMVTGRTEGCFISSFDPADVSEKIMQAIIFRVEKGQTNGRDRIIELGLDSETVAWQIEGVYKKVLSGVS